MSAKSLLLSALTLTPVLASAHPGHDATMLHLHAGVPAASNALDLRLTFAALVLGLVYLAFRSTERR